MSKEPRLDALGSVPVIEEENQERGRTHVLGTPSGIGLRVSLPQPSIHTKTLSAPALNPMSPSSPTAWDASGAASPGLKLIPNSPCADVRQNSQVDGQMVQVNRHSMNSFFLVL